jgi:hypothetical protein
MTMLRSTPTPLNLSLLHQVTDLTPIHPPSLILHSDGQLSPLPDIDDYEEEVDAYTNHDIVEKAFEVDLLPSLVSCPPLSSDRSVICITRED